MKISAMLALLLVTLALPVSLLGIAPRTTIDRVSKYTHTFYVETMLESHKCSATSIGPHALLTATHCELGSDTVTLDDSDTDIKVRSIVRDGADHSIYYLDTTFPVYAPVSLTSPHIGDDVFMIGGPAGFTDMFRRGYVAKVQPLELSGPTVVIYDLNGFHGDSGAGLFNDDGELVAVLSTGITLDKETTKSKDDMVAKFMTSLELKFTPNQLKDARQQ